MILILLVNSIVGNNSECFEPTLWLNQQIYGVKNAQFIDRALELLILC
jgi:hypothetical protein